MHKTDQKTCHDGMTNNVTIGVTPLFRQRNMVVCAIDPPSTAQKGGSIKLPKGRSQIQFKLQAGLPGDLKFRTKASGESDGFWCNGDSCPSHEMYDSQYSNPQVLDNGTTLTVDVNSSGQQNAVFYRLNFDNNCNFDPIIIHE